MDIIVLLYAALILVALIACGCSIWAYQTCPEYKDQRPLIFPLLCSMAWFLVGVEQLIAYIRHTHGTLDGATMLTLVIVTLLAWLYFIQAYLLCSPQCHNPHEVPHEIK